MFYWHERENWSRGLFQKDRGWYIAQVVKGNSDLYNVYETYSMSYLPSNILSQHANMPLQMHNVPKIKNKQKINKYNLQIKMNNTNTQSSQWDWDLFFKVVSNAIEPQEI